jgi:DHA1 family purine base/nucleoside efflux pump-like MFS transporter
VARDSRVLLVLAITVLGVVAAMSVFTYVAPLLTATAGVHGGMVGVLLLTYGLGAVVGNALGGRATDRFGSMPTLLVVGVASAVSLAALPFTATSVVGAGISLFVWSMFTWSFNPPIQNELLELSPVGGLLLSLNASAIYLGAGLSGLLGGLVISGVGVLVLPVVAAGLATTGLILMLVLVRVRRVRLAGRRAEQPVAVGTSLDARVGSAGDPAACPR